MAFWALRALGDVPLAPLGIELAPRPEHVAQVTHFGTLGSSEIVKQIKFQTRFARPLGEKGSWELLGQRPRCSWDKGHIG